MATYIKAANQTTQGHRSMPPLPTNRYAGLRKSAAFSVVLLLLGAPGEARADVFDSVRGSWSGGGVISLSSGKQERIRCRANYNGSLRMHLRCASDSYKFELAADLTASASGALSGTWTEVTRDLSGSISGTATPSKIEATAISIGFSAFLTVATAGRGQSVTLQSPGSTISSVAISLRK
jgi:hypothetical protein